MKNIYLTSKQIKRLEPISSGNFGSCYNYKNGVLKVFRSDIHSDMMSDINKNLKRESNIVMYPKRKLYKIELLKVKPSGYYMNKAPGIDLETMVFDILTGKTDLSFDDFLSLYYDKFILELKKEDALLNDVKTSHVFIDDNFYLIDTDFYSDALSSGDETYKRNLLEVNSCFDNFLCRFSRYLIPRDGIFTNEEIEKFQKEKYLDDKINYIKRLTNGSVETLRELGEYKRG